MPKMSECLGELGKVCMVQGCPVHHPTPTRTRPEDQVLPDGDESIVDDQSLIIADIEKRRQVGIERYGQGHRPFNGRNTLTDMYEEQLDFLVYLRSIVRAAEADKIDLVAVVAKALEGEVLQPIAATALAEVAVERVMSWVAGQLIEVGHPGVFLDVTALCDQAEAERLHGRDFLDMPVVSVKALRDAMEPR